MSDLPSIPEATARLFHGIDLEALKAPEHHGHLITRVLDEGDHEDLRWLVRALGEDAIARHLALHGGRGLSARSRTFCALIFGRRLAEAPTGACWVI